MMQRSSREPIHIVFCDFDGTLTKLAGEQTVGSFDYLQAIISDELLSACHTLYDLYLKPISLFNVPDYENYKACMTPTEQVCKNIQLIQDKNKGVLLDIFKLVNGAKEYIQFSLCNSNVKFIIVSRNHENYIKALLLHAGISKEELISIKIFDRTKGGGNKNTVVQAIIDEYKINGIIIDSVTVCDDSTADYLAMHTTVRKNGIPENKIIGRNAKSGQFDFAEIQRATEGVLSQRPSVAGSSLFDCKKNLSHQGQQHLFRL